MIDPDYALFARLAQAGSLSAAARELGLSPAMASKRLARLETRLGAQLVHRTTRRLSLTRAGERFHADVVAILEAVRGAEARAAGRDAAVAGPLAVTCATSFGRLHVAPHLSGFLDAYPQVELRLELSDTFTDLFTGGFDLAVRIASAADPALNAIRLGDSRRVLCAAPAYLSEHGEPASVEALASHRLLATEGQLPWRLDGPQGRVQVDQPSRVRTNSNEVVRELALAGAGVALRSLWDVQREIAEDRLRRVLTAYVGAADVGGFAVHAARPTPPAVAAFIAHLQATYSAH